MVSSWRARAPSRATSLPHPLICSACTTGSSHSGGAVGVLLGAIGVVLADTRLLEQRCSSQSGCVFGRRVGVPTRRRLISWSVGSSTRRSRDGTRRPVEADGHNHAGLGAVVVHSGAHAVLGPAMPSTRPAGGSPGTPSSRLSAMSRHPHSCWQVHMMTASITERSNGLRTTSARAGSVTDLAYHRAAIGRYCGCCPQYLVARGMAEPCAERMLDPQLVPAAQ